MLKKTVVLISLIFLGTACNSDENTTADKNKVVEQQEDKKTAWSKKKITSSNGKEFLEVKFESEFLLIPHEYIGQNSPKDLFFDIIPVWPGLNPVKSKGEEPDKNYTPIRVKFSSPLNGRPESLFEDSYFILEREFKNPKSCTHLTWSERFPHLLECEAHGLRHLYQITDDAIKTPSGNPVVASCFRRDRDKNSRLSCEVRVKWSENLSIEYTLFQYDPDYHLLTELSEIHQEIIRLIESFHREK